jgi:hypothetical protein
VGADALAAGGLHDGDAADVEDGAVGGGDGGADRPAVQAGQQEGQAGDPQAGLRRVDGARAPAGSAAGEPFDTGALELLDLGRGATGGHLQAGRGRVGLERACFHRAGWAHHPRFAALEDEAVGAEVLGPAGVADGQLGVQALDGSGEHGRRDPGPQGQGGEEHRGRGLGAPGHLAVLDPVDAEGGEAQAVPDRLATGGQGDRVLGPATRCRMGAGFTDGYSLNRWRRSTRVVEVQSG